MAVPPRRMIVLGLLTTLILLLLATAHYTKASESALATKVGDKVSELLHPGSSDSSSDESSKDEPESIMEPPYDHGTEKGPGGIGKHVHVKPSAPTPKSATIEGCEYPVVIHVDRKSVV